MSLSSFVVSALTLFAVWGVQGIATGKPTSALPNASPALAEYLARPDSSYEWHVRQRGKQGSGEFAELIVTSQTWHDIPWKHQLFIYRPAKVIDAKHVLLLIDGGSWSDSLDAPVEEAEPKPLPEKVLLLTILADMMQTPIAVIRQVPQQPLFNGLKEDQIIALTFTNFFTKGDADWPLLLPMVKSAVRAMDTVQAFAKQEWQADVERFLVTGASKRGWTTWLTAASDSRVDAIAPMVINMLNMAAHDKLQRESFGKYSEEIQDYTQRGLQALLFTEKGAALRSIVDPIAYRDQLPQPKLIILATNDAYWPVDSLNLYWNDLQGDKYILYVPNNAHGIQDYPRVTASVAALQRSLNGGPPMPKMAWSLDENDKLAALELTSDVAPTDVRQWTAAAPTRDFRSAVWTSSPVSTTDKSELKYTADTKRPSTGYRAVFLEAEFKGEPIPFTLSTTLHVIAPATSNSSAASPAAE